jgi:hypothetical protein
MSTSRKVAIRRSVEPQRLGRRTFLRGMAAGAAVSVGLPVLDIMLNGNGTALADGSALPSRFGTFYWGGGILHSAWVPTQTGMTWSLPYSLTPFEEVSPDLRNYLTLVTGYSHKHVNPGHIPARGISLSSSHNTTYVEAPRRWPATSRGCSATSGRPTKASSCTANSGSVARITTM